MSDQNFSSKNSTTLARPDFQAGTPSESGFQSDQPTSAQILEEHLRRPQVEKMTGLSSSTIYRLMQAGKFPRPKRMSEHTVAWPASVIAEYIATREAA